MKMESFELRSEGLSGTLLLWLCYCQTIFVRKTTVFLVNCNKQNACQQHFYN